MIRTATFAFAESDAHLVMGRTARRAFQRMAHKAQFAYQPREGFLYVRSRAISSRCNDNYDEFPAGEIKKAYRTFVGKPVFVNHHNHDASRKRGVIVDAVLHEDVLPGGGPDTWVEVLMEIDAKRFPRLAREVLDGNIDRTSMGCFLPGTPITMADGTHKPIEQIEVGDETVTHRGKVEPVTYIMERPYEGVVYDIRSYGQASRFLLTPEHPVWVHRDVQTSYSARKKGENRPTQCVCGKRYASPRSLSAHLREAVRRGWDGDHRSDTDETAGWIEAEDVRIGDWVLTPRVHDQEPGDRGFARLLGYYLAEGNLCWDRSRFADRPVGVEWNFHHEESEYIQEVVDLVGERGYTACCYTKHSCTTVRVNSPALAQEFLATGGQHSWAKRLAPEVLGWSEGILHDLVIAYFNGDGCYREHRVEAGTVSKALAEQMYLLAAKAGIPMTPPIKQHSPSAQKIGARPKYVMQAALAPEAQEQSQIRVAPEGVWRRVTDVRTIHYSGPVHNFDVEGDDSYVAADVAVHNCDVGRAICSVCHNVATTPLEFCAHIPRDKGTIFREAGKPDVLCRERCEQLHFFENSLLVEDPADPTAYVLGVDDRTGELQATASRRTAAGEHVAPEPVDTLTDAECPVCGEDTGGFDGERCSVCDYRKPPDPFMDPDLTRAQEIDLRGEGEPVVDGDGNVLPDRLPKGQPSMPKPPDEVPDPVASETPSMGDLPGDLPSEQKGQTQLRPGEPPVVQPNLGKDPADAFAPPPAQGREPWDEFPPPKGPQPDAAVLGPDERGPMEAPGHPVPQGQQPEPNAALPAEPKDEEPPKDDKPEGDDEKDDEKKKPPVLSNRQGDRGLGGTTRGAADMREGLRAVQAQQQKINTLDRRVAAEQAVSTLLARRLGLEDQANALRARVASGVRRRVEHPYPGMTLAVLARTATIRQDPHLGDLKVDDGIHRVWHRRTASFDTAVPNPVVIQRLTNSGWQEVDRYPAILRKADETNPAQPVPDESSTSATQSTEEVRDLGTSVDPTGSGGVMEAPSPDATADPTGAGGVIAESKPAEEDPTQPVSGTNDADARINPEPTFDPSIEQETIEETVGNHPSDGPTSTTAAATGMGKRDYACLRLARLLMQTKIEQAADDISLATRLSADASLTDEAIQQRIDDLQKVAARMVSLPSAAAQGQSREAARSVPSLVGPGSRPEGAPSGLDDDALMFLT
jgi:hypothetical protein